MSPDRKNVVLGGNFSSLNGPSPSGYGLAMVDAITGAKQEPSPINTLIRNARANAAITEPGGRARMASTAPGRPSDEPTGNLGCLQGRLEREPDLDRGLPRGHLLGGGRRASPLRGRARARLRSDWWLSRHREPPGPPSWSGVHHGEDPHAQPGNGRLLQLRRPAGACAAALVSEIHRGHLHRAESGTLELSRLAPTMSPTPVSSPKSTAGAAGSGPIPTRRPGPNLDGPRLSAASMGLTGVASTGSIRMSWPRTTTGTTPG